MGPMSLPLSSCLDSIPLLIGLPFLRILLTRMFFLPYAYDVLVFLFVSSVFAFVCVFVPCLFIYFVFVSSVSLPGDDILCRLLSCPLPSVCFSWGGGVLRTFSRFDLVWFRLSRDHGSIRSGPINVRWTTGTTVSSVSIIDYPFYGTQHY